LDEILCIDIPVYHIAALWFEPTNTSKKQVNKTTLLFKIMHLKKTRKPLTHNSIQLNLEAFP